MELDKRIKDIGTIQTILRYDVNCIGCKGYFFDEFIQTKDLSKCRYGELIDITTHDDRNDLCFKAEYEEGLVGFYRFFISEADLKPVEKKYRPYSLEEFLEIFDVGDQIEFRYKDTDDVKHAMFTGYITDVERIDDKTPGACEVMLGIFHYSLLDLFKDFERFYNGRWWPFGTEVKEKE